MRRLPCLLVLAAGLVAGVAAEKIGRDPQKISRDPELPESMPWDLRALADPPEFRWLDETSPIRALIYQGELYFNEPTEVFAWYANPETIGGNPATSGEYPGIVLIHGGGGTAFAEWVWLWASRGYAAIAMDLSGHRPPKPIFDDASGELLEDLALSPEGRKLRKRLDFAGPDQGREQKFDSIGGDVSDDWPFHAVGNVIRAHSLLRSFPEVNVRRTAVTGISWGGYTTCIVASIDNRFAAAVPVYGCGFLHEGESVQKPAIDALESPEEWVRLYDPSSYLRACRVPILFVNGNTDIHYPLDSYKKSYDLVPAEKMIRIEVGMRHSHRAGWAPEEIGLFIDSHCRDGLPLARLAPPEFKDGQVTVSVRSESPIKETKLHFTRSSGPLSKRKWESTEADYRDGRIQAAVPEGATIWLVSATDERGAMVSSEIMFAPAAEDR